MKIRENMGAMESAAILDVNSVDSRKMQSCKHRPALKMQIVDGDL